MTDYGSKSHQHKIDDLKNVNFAELMQTFGAGEARPRGERIAQAQAAGAR